MNTTYSTSRPTRMHRCLSAAALLAALATPAAHAVLLTPAYETQLESWLGQGDLTFSSIYNASGAAMSNAGFHAAADGMGPTITLFDIGPWDDFWNTPDQIVGGYNPQSWNSSGTYNLTPTLAERTAFLFNLSFGEVQSQNVGPTGSSQTYNSAATGPHFAGDLVGQLDYQSGASWNFRYGGTVGGPTITRGATDIYAHSDVFRIDEIEVLTFTRVSNGGTTGGGTAVPDAGSTAALLGLGLLGLAAGRRLGEQPA